MHDVGTWSSLFQVEANQSLLEYMQAQTMNVAEIWLWHVNTWRVAGRLQSHTLTVTQLEFSHDNRFLLSVSRDRHFSVFYLDKTGNSYSLFLCCGPYLQYLHIYTMHLYFKDHYTTKVVMVVVVVVVIHPNQPQL